MGVLYEHWDPILDECFYVGISWAQEDTRPYETSRGDAYNKRRAEIIAQGGVPEIRVTEFPGIAREALGNLEVLVIAHWRQYIGDRLTNRTKGGDGIHVIWDDEMLEKQRKDSAARWEDQEYRSRQAAARKDPEWVARQSVLQSQLKKGQDFSYLHTPDAVAKRAKKHSDARKGKPVVHLNSDSAIKKRSKTLRELQLPAKPVINLITNEKFPSAKSAAEYYGIPADDYVADSCRKYSKGSSRLVGPKKYQFMYLDNAAYAAEQAAKDTEK